MAKISDIEGIGPAIEKKLNKAGIKSVNGLLKLCCDKKGRKAIADASGLEESKILKFANMADLYRVKGIGSEYSELMEAAGVDTVKELRNRKPENLHAKMVEINTAKKLVRQLPSLSKVESFIEHAKTLDPVMKY